MLGADYLDMEATPGVYSPEPTHPDGRDSGARLAVKLCQQNDSHQTCYGEKIPPLVTVEVRWGALSEKNYGAWVEDNLSLNSFACQEENCCQPLGSSFGKKGLQVPR